MRARGIDLAGCRSKHLGEFTRGRFDYVITLCDRVREVCPEFPGTPEAIHRSVRGAGDAHRVLLAVINDPADVEEVLEHA